MAQRTAGQGVTIAGSPNHRMHLSAGGRLGEGFALPLARRR